ncbi:hypothetical protein [Persephonella sp.]
MESQNHIEKTSVSLEEYRYLQNLRESWARSITIWNQIFIPLGAGILAFFLSQIKNFGNSYYIFLFLGWGIFSLCLLYWRWVVHHIDKQIVNLYPRIIELEKELKIEIYTAYFYKNLSKRSIKYLSEKLKIPQSELRKKDFRYFKKISQPTFNHYDLIIEVWDTYFFKSVSSRGHLFQDILTIFVIFSVFISFIYLIKV